MKIKKLSTLKARAWKLFSEYIRRRDNGVCISCGKKDYWKNQHSGHYIPGSVCGFHLFFDERNVNCQCPGCNVFRHGNLTQYALALQRKFGPQILKKLDKERLEHKGEIFAPKDYERLIRKFTKKLLTLNPNL